MANLIQIKRSATTATPTSLANGELAYTSNGDVLYIGSPDGSNTVTAIGGKRYPGTLTANQALVANTTSGIDKIIVSNAVISTLWANGSAGNSGQVLVSNGTSVYWGTGTTGSNTQIQFNDSGVANASANFTFNKDTNTLYVSNSISTNTINVSQVSSDSFTVGSDFIANSSGIYSTGTVNAAIVSIGSSFSVNSTIIEFTGSTINATSSTANINELNVGQDVNITRDLNVDGNTVIGNSSSDKIEFTARVGSNFNPTANVTYSLGTNDLRWNEIHASNVHSVTGYFDGSVTISGDLNVSGNVTTTNVASVVVSDPLIYLAGNNYISDLVDIGFAGNYFDGSQQRHTGLFRDASDGVFKLFYNLTQELEGELTVNTADPTFATATLETYLNSGGLTTNTSVVNITANSTIAVSITANTLSLSTALAGTSGGTGKATMTNNAILVGNSTNGYTELTLGTSGYVLQSNGTTLVYDTLDGGSF